jgi:hypothetical protein
VEASIGTVELEDIGAFAFFANPGSSGSGAFSANTAAASSSSNAGSSDGTTSSSSEANFWADNGARSTGEALPPRLGLVSTLATGVLSGHSGRFQVVSRVSRWMK